MYVCIYLVYMVTHKFYVYFECVTVIELSNLETYIVYYVVIWSFFITVSMGNLDIDFRDTLLYVL